MYRSAPFVPKGFYKSIIDAVEDGVGVVALVQEIGEFQTKDALLPLVLRGGVEEGHALVLFESDLAATGP